jgi:predicted Zn-dependent protease
MRFLVAIRLTGTVVTGGVLGCLKVGLVMATVLGLSTAPVWARGMSLIRDAEIENTIGMIAAPLSRAAGIGDRVITIRMINDDAINAFATNGNRIFINTGTILKSRGPNELKGVIAHEIGHLAGGHLLHLQDKLDQAIIYNVLGMLAGAAAGAASGRGDVAGAVMLGAQHTAQRNLLAFSRTQENSADSFAMRALDATHQSSKGLLRFFEELGDQEALISSSQDPYVRTHPLTRDRVSALADHVAKSPYSDTPPPVAEVEAFERVQAKLLAYLKPGVSTMAKYPATDRSIAGRYAHAIAYFRKSDLGRALPLIDGLIADRPQDPYFEELRGQMLVENQRLAEGAASYERAARLAPTEPLILVSLAHAQVELGDPSSLEKARTNLKAALNLEPDNPFAWKQLANAEGKLGNEGMATFALAEMAMAQGNPREALAHAHRAEGRIPKGSPDALRLQDLIAEAERLKDKEN